MAKRITTVGSHAWNNMRRKSENVKDFKEQAKVNKTLLDYISRLQDQIDDLSSKIDDDGR